MATSNKRVSNYDFSNFDAKYEGLRKYDILALDKCFVVTLWTVSIPGGGSVTQSSRPNLVSSRKIGIPSSISGMSKDGQNIGTKDVERGVSRQL